MARRGTPLEAWMGTSDEVDFCPPISISCEAYMLFMKRERARASGGFCSSKGQKRRPEVFAF
jgi:hypothetical protein